MATASAKSLQKVNKQISTAKGGFRSQVHLGVFIAWIGLLAFGTLVMWSASFTNPEHLDDSACCGHHHHLLALCSRSLA